MTSRGMSYECRTCEKKPGEVNHPSGKIFVGMGVGWQPCPDCDGGGFVYPEHQKLRLVKDKSQAIGQFLEDMEAQGVELCMGREPMLRSRQQILADYFEIDLKKLEDEKLHMIERMRTINERC